MLRTAPASQSALRVTAQETRNLVRLKSQALREGHVILHADITYTNSRAGSFPALSAGHTRVVSRESRIKPLEGLSEFKEILPSNSQEETRQPSAKSATDSSPSDPVAPADRYPDLPDDPQQLLLKEVQIRSSIGRMERRQEQIEQQIETTTNTGQKAQAGAELERLEATRDSMQNELRKVRMARVTATQEQLLGLIVQAANQAASIARFGSALATAQPRTGQSGGLNIVV